MSATLPRTTSVSGVEAAAIRVGRGLEAWGRSRARRRVGRHVELLRFRAEAQTALDERNRVIVMATFAPYF
ncbi:MAG TPA: hypothetical protein VFG92_03845 [Agromyces sp.]|nr:hypothetical protein [Agromyces sp.]